jgi:hypothetical protein
MKKKQSIILYFLVPFIVIIAYVFMPRSESDIENCINDILASNQDHSLTIEIENRADSPLLKGQADEYIKYNIISLIQKKCGPIDIQDLVEDNQALLKKIPSLSFEMDNVNSIIVINGIVKTNKEADNIINSFNDAFNDSQQIFTMKHDIKTNRMVESSEFDIYVTLLMPSIQNVKLAQVDIKNKQLIIKGLVRDVSREQETIEQLTSLFAGDLIIVNQLELVVKHESVIEKFEFELTPLPEIEQQ